MRSADEWVTEVQNREFTSWGRMEEMIRAIQRDALDSAFAILDAEIVAYCDRAASDGHSGCLALAIEALQFALAQRDAEKG